VFSDALLVLIVRILLGWWVGDDHGRQIELVSHVVEEADGDLILWPQEPAIGGEGASLHGEAAVLGLAAAT
jgi:hypothetical protein